VDLVVVPLVDLRHARGEGAQVLVEQVVGERPRKSSSVSHTVRIGPGSRRAPWNRGVGATSTTIRLGRSARAHTIPASAVTSPL
jgi:hypothetical protein